jgi:3-methyladenine DNA glycosylase AlkD
MDFFAETFRKQGTKARANAEKAYMKSALNFHGVTMPQIRRTAADWLRAHGELDRAGLRQIVDELYASDWFDLRSAAVVLLEKRAALLAASDADWLMGLVRRSGCWAHVDSLSAAVLGVLVEEHGLEPKLRRWAKDDDFWVRRAAMLSLLVPLRRGEGDFALFAELAAPMLEEKEFFIRKAIGWILREVSKKRPQLTFAFLKKHRARLSGLTLREGGRHLPAALRSQL